MGYHARMAYLSLVALTPVMFLGTSVLGSSTYVWYGSCRCQHDDTYLLHYFLCLEALHTYDTVATEASMMALVCIQPVAPRY